MVDGGVHGRLGAELGGVPSLAARSAGPCRLRAALRPADGAGAPLARDRGLPLRVAPSARARAADEHRTPTQPPARPSYRRARPVHRAGLRRPLLLAPVRAGVRAAGIDALDLWLEEMDPPIEDQFARRGPASGRPADTPLGTGGLEQLVRPIKDSLHRRRFALKNRERLNRLLPLMRLHRNGLDDQTAYATRIRDRLIANNGRPRGVRRAIADPREAPHCAEIGPSRPIVTPTRSERGGRLRRCCSARPPRRINESARLGGDQESSLQAAAR